MLQGLSISGSGLSAESLRLSVVANNLANIDSTGAPGQTPYRRELVLLQALPPNAGSSATAPGQGVAVAGIVADPSPFKTVYDPTSPLANAAGNVLYPNVNMVTEMVDLIQASRAYQANATAFNAAKALDTKALTL